MVNTLIPINNTLSKIFENYNAAQITHALKSNGGNMQDGLNNMLSTTYSEGFADGLVNGYSEGLVNGYSEGLEHGAALGYAQGFTDGVAQSTGMGLLSKIVYTVAGVGVGIGIGIGTYLLIEKLRQDNIKNTNTKRNKDQNAVETSGKEVDEETEWIETTK